LDKKIDNNILIFCNVETSCLPTDSVDNILLHLSLTILENNEYTFSSSYNKPTSPIKLGAMKIHNIIEDDVKKSMAFNKTKTYKTLDKYANQNANNIYIIVHNAPFVKEVLKRAGIEVNNFKLIDIKQVSTHLHNHKDLLSKIEFLSDTSLNYLNHFFGLESKVREFKVEHFKNKSIEPFVKKTFVMREILFHFLSEYKTLELEKMHELSNNSVLLRKIKMRDEIMDIDTVSDKDLYFLASKSYDPNVTFTCKSILEYRGIEMDKNLISSGKYSGYYVENIDDDEYLNWLLKNMNHLDEKFLKAVEKQIETISKDSQLNNNEFIVSIYEHKDKVIIKGNTPKNVRDWLASRKKDIIMNYQELIFEINDTNRVNQEKIINRVKENVKIIKIIKETK